MNVLPLFDLSLVLLLYSNLSDATGKGEIIGGIPHSWISITDDFAWNPNREKDFCALFVLLYEL